MKTEKTRRDLLEEMNYSDGINWNKMYPPEDDRWNETWVLQK